MNLNYERSPIDGRTHRENLTLLQALSQANLSSDFRILCPGMFDPADDLRIVAGNDLMPKMAVARSAVGNDTLVVLLGMQSNDKVTACLTGWDTSSPWPGGSIYPYQTAALACRPYLYPVGGGQSWDRVRIVGHSYGGAVAFWLAGGFDDMDRSTDLKCYTYGAPKPSRGQRFNDRIVHASRRCFLLQDPVPQLPLSYDDLNSVWTLTGVPTARRWSQWYQPVWGLGLDGAGVMQSQYSPSFEQFSGPIFSLFGWATGIRAFGADAHTLNAYQRAIAMVPDAPNNTTLPETMPHNNPTPRPSAVQIETSREIALVQAGQITDADPGGAVNAIAKNVPLEKGELFRGAVRFRKNCIIYRDEIIQYCKTRRVRRALVRDLNRRVAIR